MGCKNIFPQVGKSIIGEKNDSFLTKLKLDRFFPKTSETRNIKKLIPDSIIKFSAINLVDP